MKRKGNLISLIAEKENLYLAFFKARKGKEDREEVVQYRKNLDFNLEQLQNQIISAKVDVGNYNFFKIYDPKERQICAASFTERVLHHALMNICHPIFEQQQIFHSYATRKNKGTYSALHQAKLNQKKYKYFLKLDVRKYFDSINHQVLFKLLQRKFKDEKLLAIFNQIIESYNTQLNCGLPIGNLTSQYFANFYLSFGDRYLLQELKISAYVRYMDDMVLWSNNKSDLLKIGKSVTDYLLNSLDLTLKTFVLNTNAHGLSFLGYRLFPNKTNLNKSSKKRFVNKVKQYEQNLNNNVWSQQDYQNHILPLLSYVNHAQTKALRSTLFKNKDDNRRGSNRVNRGGSWNNNASNCRVANRNNNNPTNRNNNIGFRLARSSRKGWMSVNEQIIIPAPLKNVDKYQIQTIELVG